MILESYLRKTLYTGRTIDAKKARISLAASVRLKAYPLKAVPEAKEHPRDG
jgi:hypothetical protein